MMTDEAHRSQYALLGVNLDKALPYASRIGYTGTPIDKTERVFGDYIDRYTMRQAIEDGVTLEIVYEGRTHNAEVADQSGMDKAVEDVFSDYTLQERLQILGYGSRVRLSAIALLSSKRPQERHRKKSSKWWIHASSGYMRKPTAPRNISHHFIPQGKNW